MSLLLDALKKAAEQKAQKSQEENPEARARQDDEHDAVTGVDAEPEPPGTSAQPPTQTDLSQPPPSKNSAPAPFAPPADDQDKEDTGLDYSESTVTSPSSLSELMLTGADQTFVFDAEDVSDFMGEPELIKRDATLEQETDLNRTPAQAQDQASGQSANKASTVPQAAEDTDISLPFQSADFKSDADGEQTDSAQARPSAENSDAVDGQPPKDGDTDLNTPAAADDGSDGELSLVVMDSEPSQNSSPTSATDPISTHPTLASIGDHSRARADSKSRPPFAVPQQSQTGATAPTARAANSPSARSDNGTRTESTSTRTYAPDNYDRTLMRLPSDDASKIFAGMKSDADVIMTPDYAKKVFRSKSSAQRLQHYKVYSGIAITIFLVIGTYGAFEYQDEAANIDISLGPLKQDPMPEQINPLAPRSALNPFTGGNTDVDGRILELIESAAGTDTVAVEPVESTAATIDEPAPATAAVREPISEPEVNTAGAAVANTEVSPTQVVARAAEATIKPVETENPITDRPTRSSSLEISSNSQIEQKDIWLQQAYRAYIGGKDELAMSRYNQVLDLDPVNRNALLARAAIYVQNNDSHAAIADYQTLLLANPKDTMAMTSLISVANLSPQEAETQLKLMIRDEPESPYLNFALANAYGAQNRWQEAQGYYFTALENNPLDPNYAYNLAVSLEHIAQPRAAMSYYRRALANFDNGLATFNREVVGRRLEQLEKL